MFKVSTSIIIGLLSVLAGVILVICNKAITSSGVVVSGGLLFVVAGILNGMMTMFVKDTDGKRRAKAMPFALNMIASAAAVAFGVCMLIMADEFVKFIPVVFGILVLFGAVMLFYLLCYGIRPATPYPWLFAFPVLVLAGAVLVYCQTSPDQDYLIMIYTGVSLMVFGLGMAVIGLTSRRDAKNLAAQNKKLSAAASVKTDSVEQRGLE